MKVIKTKKVSEAVEKFGEDPFKKMPEMEEETRGQIPYAGAEAIKDAKKRSEEVDKMSKDQVKAAEKDGALKNTEKDRVEPIKVKTPELKKMHLSEKLKEDVSNELDFDTFLKNADVILVDDARTFDINKCEAENAEEMSEELDDKISSEVKVEPKFIKYRLDDDSVTKIIEKLKTSTINIIDYWKTNLFLKKKHLDKKDLDDIIKNLDKEDYVTNSKPSDADKYNDAVIFVKDTKVKEFGPFNLYIKLDYDSVEKDPVIVISIHESGRSKSLKEAVESTEFDIEDLSEKYNPVAIEFADNDDGYFSVKLEDKDIEFTTWIDVIVKDDDVTAEWNNEIFYMTDPTERFKKEMQDNADVFGKADDAAINYLIDQNVIAQNDDASWYVVGKQEESIKKLHEAREVFNDPIDDEVEEAVHKTIGEDVIGNAKDGYYLMDEDECEYARDALDKQFGADIRLDFEKVDENDPNFEDFKWLMKVTKSNNREGVADDLYADIMDALTRGATWTRKRPKGLKADNGKNDVSYDYNEISSAEKDNNIIMTAIAPDEKGLDYAKKIAEYYNLEYKIAHLDKPIKGDAETRFQYYNYRCDIVIPKFAVSTVSMDDSEDND